MKDNLITRISIILLLQFLLLTGFWAIDIGASGMNVEAAMGEQVVAKGLGFERSPSNQYHMGLGLVYMVFMVQLMWILNYVVQEEYDE